MPKENNKELQKKVDNTAKLKVSDNKKTSADSLNKKKVDINKPKKTSTVSKQKSSDDAIKVTSPTQLKGVDKQETKKVETTKPVEKKQTATKKVTTNKVETAKPVEKKQTATKKVITNKVETAKPVEKKQIIDKKIQSKQIDSSKTDKGKKISTKKDLTLVKDTKKKSKVVTNKKEVPKKIKGLGVNDKTSSKEKVRISNVLGSLISKVKSKKIVSSIKAKIVKRKKKSPKKVVGFTVRYDKFSDRLKKRGNKTLSATKKKSVKDTGRNMDPKTKKIIITISSICLIVLLLEGIYLFVNKDKFRKSIYNESYNDLVLDKTDIVVVGSGDFKYSKNYSYTKGVERGKLIKYDKDGKVIFEKMYEKGISTTFSSIITIDGGYIVVGSGIFSEEEKSSGSREAFIIKYDKDGNLVWEKFYQVVSNTSFNKVILVDDGYIAIGQSIYANMEMGNHTTGGGIIVKYNFDGEVVWKNNHGGMKSGNFNGIVEVNGDLFVAGKDAADSGNIVKYDRDGNYKWHKNYNYTDSFGLSDIKYLNGYLYAVGSKKILSDDIGEDDDRKTENTDGLLIKYDLDGNVILERTFGGSKEERYNSLLIYRKDLFVVGYISSDDSGLKVDANDKNRTGLLIKYDKDGNILKRVTYGGENNDNLTSIVTDNSSLYITGYSNSKKGNISSSKNNGIDYFGKLFKIDSKFRVFFAK